MHLHARRRQSPKTEQKGSVANQTLAEVEEEPPSQSQSTISRTRSITQPLSDVPLKSANTETNHLRRRFKQSFYPEISDRQWDDWRWQVANRIQTTARLQRFITLLPEEQMALEGQAIALPLSIT
ncbi:MAG: hypothetical protein HKP58_05060, partial [Desulfatitalea sp.]|nr:hypothetical protein [Desulfatitalea sp.]NNJ99762.1 hypothetical protein [Desulfatitalea sp.]